MHTLPALHLDLYDSEEALFGHLHLAPVEPGAPKGDAIFEITRARDELATDEVRWLFKRRFTVVGDHRFTWSEGTLTVAQGDFRIVLHAQPDGSLLTAPQQPQVRAEWQSDEE